MEILLLTVVSSTARKDPIPLLNAKLQIVVYLLQRASKLETLLTKESFLELRIL